MSAEIIPFDWARMLLGDEIDERRANRSVTEHANTNALRRHGIHAIGYWATSVRTRSSYVSRRTTSRAAPARTNTTGGRVTLL